jgi:hypothetical protein
MRDDNEKSEDHDVDREEGTFDSPERDEPSFGMPILKGLT